jgi:tetratricopeptide (TPR) repeat protein
MVSELFKLRDFKIVVEAFQEFIKRNPEHDDAYFRLGQVLSKLGDHQGEVRHSEDEVKKFNERAVVALEQATKFNPKHENAYIHLAEVYDRLGFDQKAKVAWNRVSDLMTE